MRLKPLIILITAAGLSAAAIAQSSSFTDGEKKPHKRSKATNLQVLPPDISSDSLITVMHLWEASLGVNCGFCHARSATDSTRMDWASDANNRKDFARHMYTMTDSINHTYFSWWDRKMANGADAVSCYTCHHGHAEPEAFKMPAEDGERR